jgi:hypothetical protein
MRRVHFAFRAEDDAARSYTGGHTTYAVRVSAAGTMELRAYLSHPVDPADPLPAGAPADFIESGPLSLTTTSVSRSACGGPRSLLQTTIAEDGSLELHRQDAVERLSNSEGGIEQRWEMASPPAGQGDLVVRIQASGQSFVGETETGLHFKDPKTGLGFRYGWATWIGADAVRHDLRASLLGSEIVLRVPSEIVDAAAYPAVLDPSITPEFGMDQPIVCPAYDFQQDPRVAFGGGVFMVVWADRRFGNTFDMAAARVGLDGTVLDVNGIRIPAKRGWPNGTVDVASNGTDFLTVFSDLRATFPDIYGARLTAAGVLVDADAFLIRHAMNSGEHPRVAFNGSQYLAVWNDSRSPSGIYGARVEPDGTVVDPNGIYLSAGSMATVGCDGTNCLVVWQDYRNGNSDVYGVRVDKDGLPLDGTGLADGIAVTKATGADQAPAVAWSGSNYTVTWATPTGISAARVAASGGVLDNTPVGVCVTCGAPQPSFDGTNTMIAFSKASTASGARLAQNGTLLDSTPLTLSTTLTGVGAVAWGGTRHLLVAPQCVQEGGAPACHLYGVRVAADGTPTDTVPLLLTRSANFQDAPAVASDGTNYLVVWVDARAGTSKWQIWGTIVSSTGEILKPSGIGIWTNQNYWSPNLPAVAFGGTRYLVAWNTGSDIHGARVSTTGILYDGNPIQISQATGTRKNPSIAFNGTHWLVAWEDNRSGAYDIYGTRVLPSSSTPVDASGIAIATSANAEARARVASNGTDFFVIWEDGTTTVRAARVKADGTVLDSPGLLLQTDAAATLATPVVASNGTDYLAVWRKTVGTTTSLYDGRVTASGVVQDPGGVLITSSPAKPMQPALTWDGANYFTAWIDSRTSGNNDIFGTYLSAAGAPFDPAGIALSSEVSNERYPGLAAASTGKVLLTYARDDYAAPYMIRRVRGRFITASDGAMGSICSKSADCTSSNCVDGVCCDTACGGGDLTDCLACSMPAGATTNGVCGAVKAGVVCRGLVGPCDLPETCDGTLTSCPQNAVATDGTPCTGGSCSGGVCVPEDAGQDAIDGSAGTAGSAGAAGSAGSAGTAGSSGSGGTGGAAGSSGSAGSSGTAGSAGEGGAAGSGAGGAAGSAGTAGAGGDGGSAGQAGSAGEGGTAGQAGSAGEGGTAGQAGSAGEGGAAGKGGASGAGGSAGSKAGAAGAGGIIDAGLDAPEDSGDATAASTTPPAETQDTDLYACDCVTGPGSTSSSNAAFAAIALAALAASRRRQKKQ